MVMRSYTLGCAAALVAVARADSAWISASTTSVTSGDMVSVSWQLDRALDDELDEVVEKCYDESDGGAEKHQCTSMVPRGCWVGEFTPAGADIQAYAPALNYTESWFWAIPFTNPAPVKYIPCRLFSESKGTDDAEIGEYNFTVTNRRATFEYALFEGGFFRPKLVARTGPISFTDVNAPMHRRVSYTRDADDSMRVTWTSKQDASSATHVVKWGYSADNLEFSTDASTTTYEADEMCFSPATDVGFIDPGYFHSSVLASLTSGADVFYSVGSEEFGFSSVTSFKARATSTFNTKLLLTGDMGITYGDESLYHWPCPRALATATHMAQFAASGDYDATLHVGDISYATGYSTKWDRFHEMIEPVASIMPYMTCMGNHERDAPNSGMTGAFANNLDSGGECGVPTAARFITPGNEQDNQKVVGGSVHGAVGAWYSFNVGSVHVIMMNTEFDLSVGSDQYVWLESDLESVDRSVTPWVLVGGHRQFYSCTQRNAVIADALEPLFMAQRVDLVVVGHIHLAQRTCPMVNGTCVEEPDEFGYYAPVHAVVGNAGLTCSLCTGGFLPDWGTFEHGFATMSSNETNLELKFFADCEKKTDTSCRGEEPTLLHEYNMAHVYPRGY